MYVELLLTAGDLQPAIGEYLIMSTSKSVGKKENVSQILNLKINELTMTYSKLLLNIFTLKNYRHQTFVSLTVKMGAKKLYQ